MIAISLIGLLTLFWTVVFLATWNVAYCFFGWNLGTDGATLTYVVPGAPVARAGIHVGDRLDWSTLPMVGRANLALIQAVAPGSRLRVTVHHDDVARSVTLTPELRPRITDYASSMVTLAGLILVAIALGLVMMRPTRMTWGFLLSSLAWAYPFYHWIWGQSGAWKFMISNGTAAVLMGATAAGISIFMSRFPNDCPRGWLVLLDRAAIPFGIAVAAIGLYIDADILMSAVPPPAWALFVTQYLIRAVIIVVVLAALVTAYVLTDGSDRQRVIPVLFAFSLYVAFDMVQHLNSASSTNLNVLTLYSVLTSIAMLALAAAVAHGVISHRVLDVSFAISRTLVYTALTSIIVGAFVLIDFISSRLLERFQITILLETLVALGFGIWLNALHARIDRSVDSVLFRRRHLAEARLERTAKCLVHAETVAFVDEALVLEACDALDLASAAVFRREGGGIFSRVFARGWQERDLQNLTLEHHLIVHLSSELQPIDLSDIRQRCRNMPTGIEQPLLAIPFVARHDVIGFVLYGGHVGGEAIDPDEKRTLYHLAESATTAYEHVLSKALLSETNELRAENALLQEERRLLREMVEAFQRASRSIEH